MAKALRIFAAIWLSLLACSVLLGGGYILYSRGWSEFTEVFSPFNIWNFGVIAVLSLPAVGALALADRLK